MGRLFRMCSWERITSNMFDITEGGRWSCGGTRINRSAADWNALTDRLPFGTGDQRCSTYEQQGHDENREELDNTVEACWVVFFAATRVFRRRRASRGERQEASGLAYGYRNCTGLSLIGVSLSFALAIEETRRWLTRMIGQCWRWKSCKRKRDVSRSPISKNRAGQKERTVFLWVSNCPVNTILRLCFSFFLAINEELRR